MVFFKSEREDPHRLPTPSLTSLPSGCVRECSGCSHRSYSAAESQDQKFRFVSDQLVRWKSTLHPLRFEEKRLGYRQRVVLRASFFEKHGRQWKFGLWNRDRDFVSIPDCPIHAPRINALLSQLSHFLPADFKEGEFPLVFVVINGAFLTLVFRKFPSEAFLSWKNQLSWTEYGIQAVYVHLNPQAGKRVLTSKNWDCVWGAEEGSSYGPRCFFQPSPRLYEEALDKIDRFFLEGAPHSPVLDLYCGTGVSLKRWSRWSKSLLGVELNGEACRFAKKNVPEALLFQGRVEERLPQIQSFCKPHFANPLCVFVNPPRTGISGEILQFLGELPVGSRVAYLSCSPGTLRRDLLQFEQKEYEVVETVPYDFFPLTHHVEVLALLKKRRLEETRF